MYIVSEIQSQEGKVALGQTQKGLLPESHSLSF